MIRLLHCSSWSMVSWPVATIIRFMRKLLWRRIPAANALTNEFGSSRKHCTAWMRLAEKNVKKMFVNLKQGQCHELAMRISNRPTSNMRACTSTYL